MWSSAEFRAWFILILKRMSSSTRRWIRFFFGSTSWMIWHTHAHIDWCTSPLGPGIAIGSCQVAGRWQWSMDLVRQLHFSSHATWPTDKTYMGRLLEAMRAARLVLCCRTCTQVANVITYNAAMCACQDGRQWQHSISMHLVMFQLRLGMIWWGSALFPQNLVVGTFPYFSFIWTGHDIPQVYKYYMSCSRCSAVSPSMSPRWPPSGINEARTETSSQQALQPTPIWLPEGTTFKRMIPAPGFCSQYLLYTIIYRVSTYVYINVLYIYVYIYICKWLVYII